MKTTNIRLMATAFLATAVMASATQQARAQQRDFLPPTMGWSSWNTFGLNIDEKLICDQADAMVKSGLAKAGYQYINIDDGYWNGRGADGNLVVNTQKFPHGMKAVADYIHSKGLKAGIYSDAGNNACGSAGGTIAYGTNIGLAGHEYQDCKLYFNDWGYDFIKIDYCGGSQMGLDERKQYTTISNAIRRCEQETGRRIVFNMCRWAYPGTWVNEVADSWRTTGDIYDAWESYRSIIKENLYIQAYTGGGHYNDMDMLEIGRSQSLNEDRTHMAYWCIASSPLLIGCDMTKLTKDKLELLKNADLIAMNQDRLGLGAPVVQRVGEVYVVAKDMETLHGPKRAVVVMNLLNWEFSIDMDMRALGFEGPVKVHDCFTQKDTEVSSPTMKVNLPVRGCQAYFVTGKRVDREVYQAEEAWLHDYQELEGKQGAAPKASGDADQGMYVDCIGNSPSNYLEWRDVYVTDGGNYKLTFRYACGKDRDFALNINGKDVQTVNCKRTEDGNNKWGTITVNVSLKPGSNSVRIGNDTNFAPNMDYMKVERM